MSDDLNLLVPSKAGKSNNLDFIRFFLAVSVLYCHSFVLYYGTEETVEPLWVASNRQMSIGTMAVNFFFIISGFLILQSWNYSNGFRDFMKKRILRIYPGFIAASLMSILVFGALGTADWFMPYGYWKIYYQNIHWPSIFGHLLDLGEPPVPWTLKYVPIAEAINGSLWTIKYEFMCYLVVPLLALAGLFRKKWIFVVLFLMAYTYQFFQTVYPSWDFLDWKEFPVVGKPDFMPRFLTYFFSGMLFYMFKDSIPKSKILFYFSLLVFALSVFAFKGLAATQPVFGAYVLFYIAFVQSYSLKNFSGSGDFSYGLYLYAWPVQQLVIVFFEKFLNVNLLFILAFIITVCFAYFSWNYIEKPFLRLKHSNQEKKDTISHKIFKWITS